ncbi:hypothetical protein R3W88_024225 [Solanum pinnatisectum]|uniref:Pectinesterase catalytic domain-containing protein n=1 Tax=Solanum pinnatisectum TaxID=50273 RepID=A0AAV9M1G7_9SOLN|nr:hypothetical protein R3W88_024225 [Solanum pinnatisectum]
MSQLEENQVLCLFNFRNVKFLTIVMILLSILQCGGCQSGSLPPNVIVAKDVSGNYNTIMAALSVCPDNSIAQYYILIKQGIYEEYVQIDSWKTNIVFIVNIIDLTIVCFMAQDITFQNTAGPANYQAVALRASGNSSTFYRCQFDGFQDTCIILGTIDFICGDATAVFQSCLIEVRKPMKGQYIAITAQQRNDNGPTGLLGRPWGNFSRTIIMQSYIDMLINPRGWIEFEGRPRWASTTNDPRIVSHFTVRNFINGDKWIPSTVPLLNFVTLYYRVYLKKRSKNVI